MISSTVELVRAYVAKNRMRAEDLPAFIVATHTAIVALGDTSDDASPAEPSSDQAPMVSIRKSLASKDHIISMIDGKPYKMLRRHLSRHGLTPDDYRARFKLPPTYPMTAESYTETRRDLAKRSGLGRKPAGAADLPMPAVEAAPHAAEAPGVDKDMPEARTRKRTLRIAGAK